MGKSDFDLFAIRPALAGGGYRNFEPGSSVPGGKRHRQRGAKGPSAGIGGIIRQRFPGFIGDEDRGKAADLARFRSLIFDDVGIVDA